MSKVTELVKGKAGIWTQTGISNKLQRPCCSLGFATCACQHLKSSFYIEHNLFEQNEGSFFIILIYYHVEGFLKEW